MTERWYSPEWQRARDRAVLERQATRLLANDRARRRRRAASDVERHQFVGRAPAPVPDDVRAPGWRPLSSLKAAWRRKGR